MARPRRNCLERKPHFFKVLLGDFSHRLRIPPAFMKHISKEASSKRTAILEGPTSKVWHVELRKRTNGTYLQDGWKEFAKAHSLMVSEFLVFRYDGNMRFSVQIFDKTACEREDIFTSDSFQEPTFFHGTKKQGRSPKKPLDFGPAVSRQKACQIDSKNHMRDSLRGDRCLYDVGKYKPSPKPEGVIRIESEDLDLPVSVAGRVHYLQRRQHVKSDEKGKVKERANSFSSDFPFFTTIMNAFHVHSRRTVWIPTHFARAHLPEKRFKIILRDPRGKTWEVKIIVVKINNWSRYTISAGWIAFARGNNLKEGDSCIFELVGKRKMCVHIFRLSEENKAQIKSQAI
ncbi:B3 domain-containing protein Os01g0723500-like isoform X2 [Tasmannia lanceolata]|uniref:B3 domain-containing protein Os01g0723500-like isoform X2 n=1 Tax=Tasmannia lanceolata TaxID=3420 RepID=UPI0040644355